MNFEIDNNIVNIKIKNIGNIATDDVIQVYLTAKNAPTRMPLKQLAGFKRITLAQNEEKQIKLSIDENSFFATYATGKSELLHGEWEIGIGFNSQDLITKNIYI